MNTNMSTKVRLPPVGFEMPVGALTRGCVASMFEPERPVIETFTDGKAMSPIAFQCGVPMPYHIFMLFMAKRFAPSKTQSMLPQSYENGEFNLSKSGRLMLINAWSLADVPKLIKDRVAEMAVGPATAASIIRDLVNDLYTKHIVPEDVDATRASFKKLINRIEEDYGTSFDDPVKI